MTNPGNNFRPRARGFTLIEAAMVTVIIGVGVVAMLQLLAAGSMSNAASTELTTAINLSNNIREMTQTLYFRDPDYPYNWGPEPGETMATFNDIDDFDGRVFSPPIDARRQPLTEFTGWSQRIMVRTVDPNRLARVMPNDPEEPFKRVIVIVQRNGRTVSQSTWIVAQDLE
jgi:type II secretory pathway pseudopilin PulG